MINCDICTIEGISIEAVRVCEICTNNICEYCADESLDVWMDDLGIPGESLHAKWDALAAQ